MVKTVNIKIKLPYINEEVFIGNDILDFAAKKILLMNYEQIVVVIDTNFYKVAKKEMKDFFNKIEPSKIIIIKPMARYKNFRSCGRIIEKMGEAKINRKGCILAIGGGYVGDIVGFIAANYMRGIDFIQIPTTLMGMADIIIGKVAINFNGFKNLLGSFYSPRLIFCNISFLKSLDSKEKKLGLVEIWKHAILENNLAINNEIVKCLTDKDYCQKHYQDLIIFSIRAKKKYVIYDYNDRRGLHRALSLGHTFANYLEQKFYLRHGQAVFYGIIFEALFSKELGTIKNKKLKIWWKTATYFEKEIRLFKNLQKQISIENAVKELKFDKINCGNCYTFVLLTNSNFCVKNNIREAKLETVLEKFKRLKIEDYI